MPAIVEKCMPSSLFVALGGPTEVTIWSNYYVVEKGTDTSNWATVPYGYPINNMALYILFHLLSVVINFDPWYMS